MKIVMMDRDDYLSEQRKQADEETSKVIDETLESVDAVSYTHLDVYKRQLEAYALDYD